VRAGPQARAGRGARRGGAQGSRLVTERAAVKSASSCNSRPRHELVFTTRTGNAVEPRNLARSFERLTRQAGLRPIRLHDLRHTTATLLKQLGVTPRDAMEILGHSRIAVTLEIYTAADDASRRDAIMKLNGLFELGEA
jgi:integrase